jgi:hypothetical protein
MKHSEALARSAVLLTQEASRSAGIIKYEESIYIPATNLPGFL